MVTIKGPARLVIALHDALKHQERFCDFVKPMPFVLHGTTFPSGSLNWYDWCNENWGTKWDVYDIEILKRSWTDKPSVSDSMGRNPAEFTFVCNSAWSPPIPVWEALYEAGLEVTAFYLDEGMSYCGKFIDGIDYCDEANGPIFDMVAQELETAYTAGYRDAGELETAYTAGYRDAEERGDQKDWGDDRVSN